MLKKALLTAAVAACGFASPAAFAQQLYAGVGVGASRWTLDCPAPLSCDRAGISTKVFGGYQFNPTVAVEGSYVSLGKATRTSGGNVNELRGSAFEAAGVFKLPLNAELAGFAKVGVSFVKGEDKVNDNRAETDRTTQVVGGLGVLYQFTKEIALRGEWETRTVEVPADKGNTSNFIIGAQFSF
jgi:OmpA-OmpF porin, OOP family